MILWTSFKLLNVRDELCSKILYLKSPRLGRKENKNILLRNGSDSFCTLDLLSIKFCLKSRFFYRLVEYCRNQKELEGIRIEDVKWNLIDSNSEHILTFLHVAKRNSRIQIKENQNFTLQAVYFTETKFVLSAICIIFGFLFRNVL